MNRLEGVCPVFIRVTPTQYRVRCEFCGDSQKNLKDAHMYIKCGYDPTEPILYHCFKCNTSGKINKKFLDAYSISIDGLDLDEGIYNRISFKHSNIELATGNYIPDSPQVDYIEHRLGEGFTIDDYNKFKIVWDMDYIKPYITDTKILYTLPSNRNSISFISDDKSTLLIRFFNNIDRWRKIKLFPSDKSFYTIKSNIDLFTKNNIDIHITEGVFDILSIYKNFTNTDESIYIAVLGSDYESGLLHVIRNGIVGTNASVKIYIDQDIDEKYIKYTMKKYKWLYNDIFIYKNIKSHDFGTTLNNINYIEIRV